jgi:NAD(P)-dependent dehydrogenase (short-subunit alcohol dehydrogenase family)
MSFANRTAIITGASRGIGRVLALNLAKQGCNIVVAAKSTEPQPNLPGTIYTVADEIEALGAKALPFPLDVRDDAKIEDCVATTMREFGRIDYLCNNAGALWWKPIEQTPMFRYDLINSINSRGSFALAAACLPHMREAGYGHIVNQSPPIQTDKLAGMTAYYISKFGMTLGALGISQEYKGKGVAANSIWPKTLIESSATENHALGEPKVWRKAEVLTDAIMGIFAQDPNECTGNQFIDEDFLRQWMKEDDFSKYQCLPGFEPPTMDELVEKMGKFDAGRAKV